uniref:VWFC domain-containing protein n=1 Tax=Branchiostoma floridae TaxID=7739 RepID=C3Z2L5_BRAFL|eukprot:XP_002597254.1 hypothetical protein BRAFLDRAFT_66389 [Branchiostoma floridae]
MDAIKHLKQAMFRRSGILISNMRQFSVQKHAYLESQDVPLEHRPWSSCHPCQCANEPTLSGTTWVYTQWCLHIDCGCPRCVDYVFSPDQCCPTCPNGDNCDAMGTVIPGGMDVQVYGTTCRCAYYGFFLAPVVPVQSAIQSLQQLCRLL